MKLRHLWVLIAVGSLLFLSACGNDNDYEVPEPTATNTSAPTNTATRTDTVRPTDTDTPEVPTDTPEVPNTPTDTPDIPTATPTIPPADAICGNGAVEEGEECDNGTVCVGGSNNRELCEEDGDCPDGECRPFAGRVCMGGGDDGKPCAERCTDGDKIGVPCTDDSDCPGSNCAIDTICSGGTRAGQNCVNAQECPPSSECVPACADGAECGPTGCALNCTEEVSHFCLMGCLDTHDGGVCQGGENDTLECTASNEAEDCPGGTCSTTICDGGVNIKQPCDGDGDCPDSFCRGRCGSFEEDMRDLDSGAIYETTLFPLTLLFHGQVTFSAGKPRDTEVVTVDPEVTFAPNMMPTRLKHGNWEVEKIQLPGVTCACSLTVTREDLWGPFTDGGGGIFCNEEGTDEADTSFEATHALGVVGEGGFTEEDCQPPPRFMIEDGSRLHPHTGTCNDVGEYVFTGGGPKGTMLTPKWTIINLLQDQGKCDYDCDFPDKGPDCEPCTDDDIMNFVIINNMLLTTTGSGWTALYNVNRQGDTLKNTVTGVPVDCDRIMAEAKDDFYDMYDSSLWTTLSLIDPPPVGDGSVVAGYSCVLPEDD